MPSARQPLARRCPAPAMCAIVSAAAGFSRMGSAAPTSPGRSWQPGLCHWQRYAEVGLSKVAPAEALWPAACVRARGPGPRFHYTSALRQSSYAGLHRGAADFALALDWLAAQRVLSPGALTGAKLRPLCAVKFALPPLPLTPRRARTGCSLTVSAPMVNGTLVFSR